MRLSVMESDPGYRPDVFSLDVEVFCDDVRVEYCITADEERGFALYYVRQDDSTATRTATVQGKVEIRGL